MPVGNANKDKKDDGVLPLELKFVSTESQTSGEVKMENFAMAAR